MCLNEYIDIDFSLYFICDYCLELQHKRLSKEEWEMAENYLLAFRKEWLKMFGNDKKSWIEADEKPIASWM